MTEPSNVIRVAIIDDHAVIRLGLRQLLNDQAGIVVTAEAENGAQAVSLLRRVELDVVLLDLAMPEHGGLEALQAIRLRWPDLPVVVFSGYPERLYADTVMRLGAHGYINKGAEPALIIQAIERAHRDGTRKPDPMPLATPTGPASPGAAVPHDELTPREFQVFLRLARGETNPIVGQGMSLSAGTVSTYRTRLMRKLSLHTNGELTYYALKHGLI